MVSTLEGYAEYPDLVLGRKALGRVGLKADGREGRFSAAKAGGSVGLRNGGRPFCIFHTSDSLALNSISPNYPRDVRSCRTLAVIRHRT